MSETPKRRFWQIHLSTAVAMMIVAGALLYLNLFQQNAYPPSVDFIVNRNIGWPYPLWISATYETRNSPESNVIHVALQEGQRFSSGFVVTESKSLESNELGRSLFHVSAAQQEWWYYAVDASVFLLAIVATMVSAEYFTRRRFKP